MSLTWDSELFKHLETSSGVGAVYLFSHTVTAYRDDRKCGGEWLAPSGEVAKCDPVGLWPCCSDKDLCENTQDFCDCEDCVDYRIVGEWKITLINRRIRSQIICWATLYLGLKKMIGLFWIYVKLSERLLSHCPFLIVLIYWTLR